MPATALGLLIIAALIHASWNLLLKRTADQYIVSWWALLASALVGLPILLTTAQMPATIWPYALASALAEAIYFGLLATAYRSADFSLIYPIARGTAPALLALWSALFLGERLSMAGLAGLGLIIAGLIIVGLRPTQGRVGEPDRTSITLAIGVALCVSIYSVIDGAAVKQISPLPYTALVFSLSVIMLTPLMLWRYGASGLLTGGRAYGWQATLVGGLMLSTYAIVLQAYVIAPVSYAGAVRESSIVVGALAGWLIFGEPFGIRRVAGSLVILAGITIISLWG
ncbi:MAG: EamA family transporter [Oscillochloris sp.]|nr:EamA family transporter [Oscillochloris sp.]